MMNDSQFHFAVRERKGKNKPKNISIILKKIFFPLQKIVKGCVSYCD